MPVYFTDTLIEFDNKFQKARREGEIDEETC
jgi:hypothetical protein